MDMKTAYATFRAIFVIYNNKVEGRRCAHINSDTGARNVCREKLTTERVKR